MERGEQANPADKIKWYVISPNRVKAVRIHVGMTIGETESGELSFDQSHAQLELDTDSNSLLVLRALGNIRMAPADEQDSAQQTDTLTCNRPVRLSLAHNNIQIDQEFATLAPSKRPLQLRVVYPPEGEVVNTTPISPDHYADTPREQSTQPSSQPAPPLHAQPVVQTTPGLPWERRQRERTPIRQLTWVGAAIASLALVLGVLVMYPSSPPPPPAPASRAR